MLPALGPSFWLMMFVWGGVSWSMYGLGLALLGERFRPAQLAAANAAFVMLCEVGSMAGSMVSGAAMDYWPGWGLTISVGSVAALFIVVAFVRQPRG